MLRNIFVDILEIMWPSLLICAVIFASLRITWVIKNKVKIDLFKEIMMIIFGIYVLCIFYVVTYQDVNWSTSNFMPFKEIFRYSFGSRLFIKNVVGNMIMFMPYGFFITYFVKTKKVYIIMLLSLILSVTIETTQLIIGRVFDIDDIMLNLVGAVIGFLIFRLFDILEDKLPKFLKKNTYYAIVLIFIIILFVLYLMKVIKIGV